MDKINWPPIQIGNLLKFRIAQKKEEGIAKPKRLIEIA